jgi:hypothetical protein
MYTISIIIPDVICETSLILKTDVKLFPFQLVWLFPVCEKVNTVIFCNTHSLLSIIALTLGYLNHYNVGPSLSSCIDQWQTVPTQTTTNWQVRISDSIITYQKYLVSHRCMDIKRIPVCGNNESIVNAYSVENKNITIFQNL